MGKAGVLILIATGFGILLIIGLPGLIIHYVQKARDNSAATKKDKI